MQKANSDSQCAPQLRAPYFCAHKESGEAVDLKQDSISVPPPKSAAFAYGLWWKRKRPIAFKTRNVTTNPAKTMTNSRVRIAITNIQSPLLDPAGAAEYRRSSW